VNHFYTLKISCKLKYIVIRCAEISAMELHTVSDRKQIGTPSNKHYPRTLVDNAKIASYHGEPQDTRLFTLFPKLPPEIRFKIWQCAISVPRIIEPAFDKHWHFKKTHPPPLLSSCAESRRECLKAYETTSSIAGPAWIRFDWDILYLKHLNFSEGFAQPNFQVSIKRWDSQDEEVSDESNKWIGKPRFFEKVHTLAINREVLTQTWDDYECIIRHFFPHLKLLVVLIDDGIMIDEVWDIKNNDFEAYEGDWGEFPPRWEFTRGSTGPFTVIFTENMRYKEYIEIQMEKHFKREEEDYEDYITLALCVMGCWLPPGVEIPECGRWPDDWTGWVRTQV
jgi:hypothetical protein